jgi:LysM repeat protein
MTAVDPGTRTPPPVPGDAPLRPPVTGICPYLAAADGAWRSTTVAREHRCGAVAPPAMLAAEKQRRLCLTDEHVTCATYEAARMTRPNGSDRATTLPRPLARTTPVVLDHGRIAITVPALRGERLSGQALLIVLLGLAFAAILLARLTGGGAPGALADTSPTPRASGAVQASTNHPTASARSTGSAEASDDAGASPDTASEAPSSAQPSVAANRTYKIKSGDTLVGIAAKYDTTPKAIAKLNGITNPSNLKVGQVLKIPDR